MKLTKPQYQLIKYLPYGEYKIIATRTETDTLEKIRYKIHNKKVVLPTSFITLGVVFIGLFLSIVLSSPLIMILTMILSLFVVIIGIGAGSLDFDSQYMIRVK